jgi:hypothetical protein
MTDAVTTVCGRRRLQPELQPVVVAAAPPRRRGEVRTSALTL